MASEYQRRHFFVDREFQMKFIVRFCGVVIFSSLLMGLLIFLLLQNSTTVAIENTKVLVKPTADFILPALAITILVVVLFSAVVVFVLTLFISHRIMGPAYRLTREINLLEKGDLNRDFSIRENDELQELAKSLEDLTASLKQKLIQLKDQHDILVAFLKNKNYTLSSDDRDEFETILKECRRLINYFKLE